MIFWILVVILAIIFVGTVWYWIAEDGILAFLMGLRALGNSSTLQGEFYLGSGYIDGAQQFSYVEQGDGYSMLLTADASASRVFENATKPTVIEYTHYYSNPWVLPWNFDTGMTYDFHVPKGTVQTNYQVSTSK